MNFKNISRFLAAVCTIACLGSCGDDFFKQYPSNSITEGNMYQTDEDFNQAVASCYSRLKSSLNFHMNELSYRSDENVLADMGASVQDRYDIDHFAETPNNGIVSTVWDAWYNGIYRCNDILEHMQGKSLPNGDKYRGECLFMRSWWYFCLYRTFGVVPVTRTVATPADAKNIPRCTKEEMWNLLYNDLREAAGLLPDHPGAEVARASGMAANTLLGKVCLTFGKYPEAQAALDNALANTNYGMMPTTGATFNAANKMNREIIFALYYNKGNGEGHAPWCTVNTNVASDIPNPCAHFKEYFDAADNRYALVTSYTKLKDNVYVMNKWLDSYDAVYTTDVGNDFPHLRYADVVLMYAETLCRMDNIPDALPFLNQTRVRAGLDALQQADVPDEESFIRELADERAREMAFEGHRWYDLNRLGLSLDLFAELGYTFTSKNLLFPIPQGQIEIVNNPSILWQNPGY